MTLHPKKGLHFAGCFEKSIAAVLMFVRKRRDKRKKTRDRN